MEETYKSQKVKGSVLTSQRPSDPLISSASKCGETIVAAEKHCTSARLPIGAPSDQSRDFLVRIGGTEDIGSDSRPVAERDLHVFLENGVRLECSISGILPVALG
jgi:hypothetical protein